MTAMPPLSDDAAGAGDWAYGSGSWLGAFGPAATLFLPGSAKDRIIDLWSQVDDGDGFDEVLDTLLGMGLGGLSGFVLIGTSPGSSTTTILMRGAGVSARLTAAGERVDLDATSAVTWVEHSVSDLTSLEVVLETVDDDTTPRRIVESGLVRVSRVEWPAPVAGPEPEHEHKPVVTQGPVEEPVVEESAAEEPVVEEPPAEELPVDLPPTEPDDALTDPVGLAPLSTAAAMLLISNGDVVEVDRVIVLGRAPQAHRFSADEEPRLVTVPSPLQEISSTHVEVRPGTGPDEGAAVVTDLGSTNGTVLTQPGHDPEDLQAGVGVRLAVGATINLGDGVTISVA